MRRKTFGMMLAALAIFVGSVVNADDEKIANHLYKKLSEAKQQGSLKDFTLDMEVADGVVFLKGRVATKKQKSMVLTMAQKAQNLGVTEIRDGITIGEKITSVADKPPTSSRARQASANSPVQDFDYLSQGSPRVAGPVAAPAAAPSVVPATNPTRVAALPNRAPRMAAMPPRGPMPNMGPRQMGPPMQGGPMQAPAYMPVSGNGPANGARYDEPGLPNYAWPSYAPHPNYGAVTYPKTYSPTAWPYIGPFYPYPQVPLGWRKVTLEWDDGWWYLDFNDR